MELGNLNLVSEIYNILIQLTPLFRMIWGTTTLVGIAMVGIAFTLKNNSQHKKLPWIIEVTGVVMAVSSGTQLLFSFIRI